MAQSEEARRAAGARARGLGAELAELRGRATLTTRQVAERVGLSPTTINRIEKGNRRASSEEVAKILVVYQLAGVRLPGARGDHLIDLARDVSRPDWFETRASGLPSQLIALAAFESQASRITEVSPLVVPGLLQTAEYARAVMAGTGVAEAELDKLVAARMSRQVILSRPVPPKLHVLVDEGVLHRPVGGRAVLAGQLRHLAEMARRPNITIQVLRKAVHPGIAGLYLVLEFPPPATPYVHLEHRDASAFLDRAEDVRSFLDATDIMTAMALNPPRSAELLTRLARQHEQE